MKIPKHLLKDLDVFTAPPLDGDHEQHLEKAVVALYEAMLLDINKLTETLEFYAKGINSEHYFPVSAGVLGETARATLKDWTEKYGL